MRTVFLRIDRFLSRFSGTVILFIALSGIALVGVLDYLTGHDISMSLFYLAPVAIAAWYNGRLATIGIACLSCVVWYAADTATGYIYAQSWIPIWNAIIRLGFFLINGLLMVALHDSLFRERSASRTDILTGISSRRAFEERLEHGLGLARRTRNPITLAYLDIDNFKTVNDRHGHAEGDRVLRVTGQTLKDATRQTDTAARLGGDEFALVLPNTDRHGAEELLSKLRLDLYKSLVSSALPVTFSIGAITFFDAPHNANQAVEAVDALMYAAKRQGKDALLFSVVDLAPE